MSCHKIFAIIDPSTDNQRALKRAVSISKRWEHTEIMAYCCIHANLPCKDQEALRQVEIKRYELWLEYLIAPYKEEGINIQCQVEWDPEWRDNLGVAANEYAPDVVIKSSHSKTTPGRLRKTSDWRLLRTSKSPVLLVKRQVPVETGTVLAAIKSHEPDELHQQLNEGVVGLAKKVVDTYPQGEIHAVNAYTDWKDMVNPADLAHYVGIKHHHAHSIVGSPEMAIKQVAREIKAELVIIGTAARDGIAGRVFGNTVERVLDQLDCDVCCLVASKPEG